MVVRIASPNCFSTLLLIAGRYPAYRVGRCVSSHPQTQGACNGGLVYFHFSPVSHAGAFDELPRPGGSAQAGSANNARDCRDQRRDSREIVFCQQLTTREADIGISW